MPRFPLLLLLVLVVDFFSKAPPPGSDLDARIISVHRTASCNSIKRSEEKNDHQFHDFFFNFLTAFVIVKIRLIRNPNHEPEVNITADRKSEAETFDGFLIHTFVLVSFHENSCHFYTGKSFSLSHWHIFIIFRSKNNN